MVSLSLFAGIGLRAETDPGAPVPIPVSAGTSITIWEQTGWVDEYEFSVDQITTSSGVFFTSAQITEMYTVTSDGVFLRIDVWRDPPTYLPVYGPGGNIVAARLNGAPGFPDGIWASGVVDYNINVNGTAASVMNALGHSDQMGPYNNMLATSLGDYGTYIVLSFSESLPCVEATLDMDPDVLSVKSMGKYLTAYLELPSPYTPEDVDLSTVMLNSRVPADTSFGVETCDEDEDGVDELMMKFSRPMVKVDIVPSISLELEVMGMLSDGKCFKAGDTILIIDSAAL